MYKYINNIKYNLRKNLILYIETRVLQKHEDTFVSYKMDTLSYPSAMQISNSESIGWCFVSHIMFLSFLGNCNLGNCNV